MTRGSIILLPYEVIPKVLWIFQKGDLAEALGKLDDFGEDLSFLLGHNLIGFDAPHLLRPGRICACSSAGGGHAASQPAGLSPQSLSPPGKALSGRPTEARGG